MVPEVHAEGDGTASAALMAPEHGSIEVWKTTVVWCDKLREELVVVIASMFVNGLPKLREELAIVIVSTFVWCESCEKS